MGTEYTKVVLLLALNMASITSLAQNAGGDSVVQKLSIPQQETVVATKEERAPSVNTKTVSTKANNPKNQGKKSKVVAYEDVIDAFYSNLEETQYFSSWALQTMRSDVRGYVDALKDRDNEYKRSYIDKNGLEEYLADAKYNWRKNKEESENIIKKFLEENYSNVTLSDEQACKDLMSEILKEHLQERDSIIAVLQESMKEEIAEPELEKLWNKYKSQLLTFSVVVVAFVVFLILLIVFKKSKKKNSTVVSSDVPVIEPDKSSGNANIVVRRKTQAILKKQSLDDVLDNPAYMVINCSDFCDDSAVRRMYIKNTCIIDIYNMYADDLRKTDDPCEDGCMVLGRWVYDEQNDEYYVSLEEIVRPGDDAVLQEYELNFGGKIKLKVSERLRKLRRETNLQYDLTCWVHSHPGLGVFFSQADNSVHMQLKHPTHPKFLTAIVVDILTPNQELAIFTFKHDLSINSKPEIYKMYSLDKMYKWALESNKNSLKEENYYNITQNVQSKNDAFHNVLLSSSTIIDMCQLDGEQRTGLVGALYGGQREYRQRKAYVSDSVKHEMSVTNEECCGCFVIGTHRSIPTIRKAIADNIEKIHFVLFLSTVDGIVTSIPVNDGQISVDESLYGEAKLEDLKIWTRRKR